MGTEESADPANGHGGRNSKPCTIEITGDAADLLQARAAELGISVAELVAALAATAVSGQAEANGADPPAAAEPTAARWRDVKAWIDSWGKPDELPRPKLGK